MTRFHRHRALNPKSWVPSTKNTWPSEHCHVSFSGGLVYPYGLNNLFIIPNLWSPNLVHQHWPPPETAVHGSTMFNVHSVEQRVTQGLVKKETVVLTPEGSLFLGVTSGGSRICHDSRQTVPDSQQRTIFWYRVSHIENMTKKTQRKTARQKGTITNHNTTKDE